MLKKGGNLSEYSKPIDSINEYYDKITEKVNFKNMLKIFLTIPSYILRDEFKCLLSNDNYENIEEFINLYPYLFNIDLNRVSLFHDSFNNYLRTELDLNDEVLEIIKENILSKNIRYLSRFNTINFDDEFLKEVLILYSNFETFKEIYGNFDFESIKLFYLNLRKILKKYPNTLNIYQYTL